jgi:outer membrane receptor protein involved in Fe transport
LNYTGDGFDIVSSTSYFDRKIFQFDDNTEASNYYFETELGMELGDPIWIVYGDIKDRRFTHETRLSFAEGTIIPRFSGTVGVFYQRQVNSGYNPGVFVQELADAGVSPPYMADTGNKDVDKNSAIFGELYYEVLPRLNLTLGLRQYWLEQKTHAWFNTGFVFGEEGQLAPESRNKESGLVPKAVVSYEIGDRGNVYASISKGFRPGGSASALPDFCEADLANLGLTLAGAGAYESDTLWSYEVGAKSRLADGRVNASVAAFRMDWSDIQQVATLPLCGLTFTTNAGEARIQGAEFEVGGRPFAELPLTLQFGVGYTDAKLLDPGFIAQAPNSRLALVPEWTGSISGYYEMPLNREIDWFVAADYSYTGSSKVPNVVAGQDVAEFVTRQPINLVNGNFGLKFGRSQVMFYVKNAFDKRLTYGDQPAFGFEFRELQPDGTYIRLPRGVVSRPRQLGVQYQMNF